MDAPTTPTMSEEEKLQYLLRHQEIVKRWLWMEEDMMDSMLRAAQQVRAEQKSQQKQSPPDKA